ncbi:hypothetical protein AAFF_G00217800 [Aldrovandia affinis]|uniref:Uncharacterized protein n=1 Tax=Aldrovandia affinis TaxID=143900 RepID=A0AAD7WU95_9TELE|nr:hypothetical protein AAFF_G00217800 [Aldrovandia affinis]
MKFCFCRSTRGAVAAAEVADVSDSRRTRQRVGDVTGRESHPVKRSSLNLRRRRAQSTYAHLARLDTWAQTRLRSDYKTPVKRVSTERGPEVRDQRRSQTWSLSATERLGRRRNEKPNVETAAQLPHVFARARRDL